MTREQAKKKLIDLGVAEPTEEQVTKYLDGVSEETKLEKAKNDRLKAENEQLKADQEKLGDLQKQIDDAETAKMSEMEKMTKALETANSRVAELEKKDLIRSLRDEAMFNYKITADQAKKVVKDDGTYDAVILGQIISEKEAASATAKEQEIANASANPGGAANKGGNGNSVADELAMASAKRAGTANQDILNHYRR